MSMVVDTCIILDVLEPDPVFGEASANALESYATEGLIIAPVTYVELAPAFLGNERREREFLTELGIELPPTCNEEDLSRAHAAWYRQVLAKRAKKTAKRPVADIMIGALAEANDGLITRNAKDFTALFPDINIVVPK